MLIVRRRKEVETIQFRYGQRPDAQYGSDSASNVYASSLTFQLLVSGTRALSLLIVNDSYQDIYRIPQLDR